MKDVSDLHKQGFLFLYYIFYSLALSALLIGKDVLAIDLWDMYKLARDRDPGYQQSIAQKNIILEDHDQALSLLFPSVYLEAGTRSIDQDISGDDLGIVGDISFNNHHYSFNVSQPLFSLDRWIALDQADKKVLQAEAELILAGQDLMIRVAEHYFSFLYGQDNLEFARAGEVSLGRQFKQARQRFELGLTAITDVQEAHAGYDHAVATQIQVANELDNIREAIWSIIYEYPGQLAPLSDDMPLLDPEPADIVKWSELASEHNVQVLAVRHALDIAREEIKLQTANHSPTLDLVASYGYTSSGGRFGSSKTHSSEVGIELNMPLYQGGRVRSQVRQAHARYALASHQFEQVRRNAQRSVREAYLGVISGISQVKAFKQVLSSSETALQSTINGFELGTRTSVDVVEAERLTFAARKDYARARYDYILSYLRLKQAAGILSVNDLQAINQWLYVSGGTLE